MWNCLFLQITFHKFARLKNKPYSQAQSSELKLVLDTPSYHEQQQKVVHHLNKLKSLTELTREHVLTEESVIFVKAHSDAT